MPVPRNKLPFELDGPGARRPPSKGRTNAMWAPDGETALFTAADAASFTNGPFGRAFANGGAGGPGLVAGLPFKVWCCYLCSTKRRFPRQNKLLVRNGSSKSFCPLHGCT